MAVKYAVKFKITDEGYYGWLPDWPEVNCLVDDPTEAMEAIQEAFDDFINVWTFPWPPPHALGKRFVSPSS